MQRHTAHQHRPELHVTAETGVLEAPAGAVFADGLMHVFHQFRPRANEGSRWAHQIATSGSYDWDVCDDVLAPAPGEADILAGSAVPIGDDAVELFFVVTAAESDDATPASALGTTIAHGERGQRTFSIHRAVFENISDQPDISDDPTVIDSRVTRLGPITVAAPEDAPNYDIDELVTPCVVRHDDPKHPESPWLMLALNLRGDADAEIAVLRSSDRQHWQPLGQLRLPESAGIPAERPFSPRLITTVDAETGAKRDVIFVTYPDATTPGREYAGYLVGNLRDVDFEVITPFTVIDYGHDFTRPRLIPHSSPVMVGLVGAHPSQGGRWANCLSTPRYLTLAEGVLYQDIIGAPDAVLRTSDFGYIWAAQLDAESGTVIVDVTCECGDVAATVRYDSDSVSVTLPGDSAPRTAPLVGADSDTLTVFIDGPILEVFADGGAVTLTSTLPSESPLVGISVRTEGGARVISAMETGGQEVERTLAGLTSPEDQEAFMAEALLADRQVAEALATPDPDA